MSSKEQAPQLDNQSPAHNEELFNLQKGLSAPQKWISPIYFYDEIGSKLFDRITEQPEYYLTRSELEIMRRFSKVMGHCIGARAMIVEPGSGAGEKVGLLLRAIEAPVAYVPVEISRTHLAACAKSISREFPQLEVRPVWSDFTTPFSLPTTKTSPDRRVIYFPGSTLGNFEPEAASRLLAQFSDIVGEGGGMLLGVDLVKDKATLEAAYNDKAGVTAAFNLNMLAHLNRRFDIGFIIDAFSHYAVYNEDKACVDMYLESQCDQSVTVGDMVVRLSAGERIHTESSYKYSDASLNDLLKAASLRLVNSWKDDRDQFGVCYVTTGRC